MRDPVKDELDFHIERRTEELMASGVPADEARRRAMEAFGDLDEVEAACARIRRRRRLRAAARSLLPGFRHAVRGLVRHPGHAALVVGTLALGIGSVAAMFSVVDTVLLEPLPFHEPDRLVHVWESDARRPRRNPSPADFLDLRRDVAAFERVTAYDWRTGNLTGDGEPERVVYGDVSADFFHTLGVGAAVGRVFGPDPVAEGVRQVVLSHGLWSRRYGSDPGAVGRTVRLDGRSWEIVGVMPEGFVFPEDVVLWTAAPFDVPGADLIPGDPTSLRDAWYHQVVARLAPGVTPEAAGAEVAGLAARLAARYPDSNAGADIWLAPLHDDEVRDVRSTLLMLLGATGLVLLIVCANVANLVLVRAADRAKEWSVRRALGAPRGRVVGQVLGESLVLAGVGALLGTGVAWLALEALRPVVAPLLPPTVQLGIDGTVLAVASAAAVGAALAFGALPAWSAASQAPGAGLSFGAGARAGSRRDRRVREGLVAAETALAVVLVLVSGLLLRSLWSLQTVDLGFAAEALTGAWVGLPDAAERTPAERLLFYEDVGHRVEAFPGVEAAAWAQQRPVDVGPGAGLRIRGGEQDDLVSTRWQAVSAGWFDVIGVPVLRGRGLTADDVEGSERVAVVNEALVRRFFPDADPIGQVVNTGLDGRDGDAWRWVRIVGVVGDTRNRGPGGVVEPMLFRPMAQHAPGFRGDRAFLAVRAPGSAVPSGAALRAVVRAADPDAPVDGIVRGDALAAGYLSGPRLVFGLVGAFAALALALGAVGVYGIARFAVLRRTREIGVRMAMGARGGQVAGMVLRQGLRPVMAGMAVGLAASLLTTGLLERRLFGVDPLDPLTYAAVPALLLGVAVVATWLPARRAARIDPVRAIRIE